MLYLTVNVILSLRIKIRNAMATDSRCYLTTNMPDRDSPLESSRLGNSGNVILDRPSRRTFPFEMGALDRFSGFGSAG